MFVNTLLQFPFPTPWPTATETQVLVPLLLALIGFLSYWWVHYSEGIRIWFDNRWPGDEGQIKRVVTLKIWGLVVMGVLPAYVLTQHMGWRLEDLGVRLPEVTSTAVWLWWLFLIVTTIGLSIAARKEGAKNYPQIRATHWTGMTMFWSAAGWTIYLSAYEFMFRGFLFFPLATQVGVWPAIAISTMLYSVTHFHKGKGETLWCLPVGVMTCWMTLETGSLFHTALGHIVVSWVNTAFHVSRNPQMHWMGLKKAREARAT